MVAVVVALAETLDGRTICPAPFSVAARQTFAPEVIRPALEMFVPAAMGKVWPPIVIDPARRAVAAVYWLTTPQMFTDVETSAETEAGDVICPLALRAAWTQTWAPAVRRSPLESVVPAAMTRGWPSMVSRPGARAVAAV